MLKHYLSWRLLLVLILILAFAFTRLYRLHDSLLYFIDIGRDDNVLLDWYQTGKPPLLGPQTSAIYFKQSAVYFYLLYPLFIVTHFSAFSTIYTTVIIYCLTLIAALALVRGHPVLRRTVMVFWLLAIFQPQVVIQTRF